MGDELAPALHAALGDIARLHERVTAIEVARAREEGRAEGAADLRVRVDHHERLLLQLRGAWLLMAALAGLAGFALRAGWLTPAPLSTVDATVAPLTGVR